MYSISPVRSDHVRALALIAMFAGPWGMGAGCTQDDKGEVLARVTIGPDGGTVEGGGVTLQIPARALTADTEIVLRRSRKDLSARDFVQQGGALLFEPEGKVLRLPAQISLDKPPEAPAVLFRQDGLTVAGIGSTTYLNELGVVAPAVAGAITARATAPELASTPEGAASSELFTDRVHLSFEISAVDTPQMPVTLTAYDLEGSYDDAINGDGVGDCAFKVTELLGGSLSLGCASEPTTATISTSSSRVEFDAVPFQANKLETPVVVGVIAGSEELAFFQGFFRFNTGPCFGETCDGHGICEVVDGGGQCTCDAGYAANGLACECIPQCEGRECGGDSCGGSCAPGCGDGMMCSDGSCVPDGGTSTGGSSSGGSSGGSGTSGGGSGTSGGTGGTSGGSSGTSGGTGGTGGTSSTT